MGISKKTTGKEKEWRRLNQREQEWTWQENQKENRLEGHVPFLKEKENT